MRVLFWGTPDFATPALRALLGEGSDVVGVVTQPDRPRGRSRTQLEPSPVKRIALTEHLPVLQPEKPRGDEFIDAVRALDPEISVVVAYGNLLPLAVIDLPSRGTINIHASLLPAWRGAAPIQAAIRNGDDATGITIMRMVRKMDAGPSILQVATPIGPEETYGELQMRLSELGALALIEAMAMIELDIAGEKPQDESMATFAHKVEREHTIIDWNRPSASVSCQIRAYDPRPGALTTLHADEVKLYAARDVSVATDRGGSSPGTVLSVDPGGLVVACGSGAVRVSDVQPAGKRRMRAAEWGRGRGIAAGDRFGG